jgi:predicted metallopeptidase
MAQYTLAPAVKDIANKLIEKYHNHLQGFKIIYLFRDKSMKSKGKEVYGKASKVQSKYQAITGATFVIEIAEPAFASMDHKHQVALIDHELMHCFIDENEQPTILSHDFEGFNKELKRHGFWASDLQIMEKQLEQMQLSFDEKKPDLKVVSG